MVDPKFVRMGATGILLSVLFYMGCSSSVENNVSIQQEGDSQKTAGVASAESPLTPVEQLAADTPDAAGTHCFFAGDASDRDLVTFNSDAPVEVIEGTTTQIHGKVCFNESLNFNEENSYAGYFEVDLASVDTGIALRNEHMRDNFLHTDKYPVAKFKATKIETPAQTLQDGKTYTLDATGDFTIHGKTVTKKVPLEVTYHKESDVTKKRFSSGDMLRIKGTFPVTLAEHDIERPQAVLVKLAETVYVTVDTFASSDPNALVQ